MADITMCTGQDCPMRDRCYRVHAPAHEYWQSYFTEPPFDEEKCEEFLPNTSDKERVHDKIQMP